jgi:hypothetical protein
LIVEGKGDSDRRLEYYMNDGSIRRTGGGNEINIYAALNHSPTTSATRLAPPHPVEECQANPHKNLRNGKGLERRSRMGFEMFEMVLDDTTWRDALLSNSRTKRQYRSGQYRNLSRIQGGQCDAPTSSARATNSIPAATSHKYGRVRLR